jgi:hypothetical protein
MSQFDPASFMPQGASFGSNMGAMAQGFEKKAQGADMKTQMGGAAGMAGGAMELMGSVTSAVPKVRAARDKIEQGQGARGRLDKAQAGIDIAASAASMAGPWGQVAGGVLKMISMFMNIQGPRQKRQKRAMEQRNRQQAKHTSMRANAASAGMRYAGGALRTGGAVGPEPTVAPVTNPVQSFNPSVSPNG